MHRINLPTPLLADPETRKPISVADFEAAFKRDHPSITYAFAAPAVPPLGSMKIFVHQLTGETLTLAVEPDDTIEILKLRIFHLKGIQPEVQRIIFNAQLLASTDERTLAECGIVQDSHIILALTLRGD